MKFAKEHKCQAWKALVSPLVQLPVILPDVGTVRSPRKPALPDPRTVPPGLHLRVHGDPQDAISERRGDAHCGHAVVSRPHDPGHARLQQVRVPPCPIGAPAEGRGVSD
jgi:hypothetical protein